MNITTRPQYPYYFEVWNWLALSRSIDVALLIDMPLEHKKNVRSVLKANDVSSNIKTELSPLKEASKADAILVAVGSSKVYPSK